MSKFTEKDIESRVILTNVYDGLTEGSTGTIVSIDSYGVNINYIEGFISEWCEDCDSYTCGCYDKEDWDDDHYDLEEWYVSDNYIELVDNTVSIQENSIILLLL